MKLNPENIIVINDNSGNIFNGSKVVFWAGTTVRSK